MKPRFWQAVFSFVVVVAGLAAQTTAPLTPQTAPAGEARLVNLSTRATVSAENPLITGFSISGTTPRTVLVRVTGPSLATFGVTDALAAPRLRLHNAAGEVLTENAGWADSAALSDAFAKAGAFPFAAGSADAAVVITLEPGTYSVHALDASNQGRGVVLSEVYDIDSAATDSRLVNVSSRAVVGVTDGEVISGFVLAGTAPRKFLVRGIGPGLATRGVADALLNPTLSLFDSTGQQLATNDNWSLLLAATATGATNVTNVASAVAAAAASAARIPIDPAFDTKEIDAATLATGAFPLNVGSNDAAFIVTLVPGAYTAQMMSRSTFTHSSVSSMVNGGAAVLVSVASLEHPARPGTGLLEIYELP